MIFDEMLAACQYLSDNNLNILNEKETVKSFKELHVDAKENKSNREGCYFACKG